MYFKALAGNPLALLALLLLLVFLVLRKRSSSVFRIVIINLIVVAALGALFDTGGALRTAPYFRIEDDSFHHGLMPNVVAETFWGSRRYRFVTNSLGMVDREPRRVLNEAASRRFLILGDSFSEGVGYEYDSTFAGIIDGNLRAAGCEVLNASVMSYSPKLYYYRVADLLRDGLEFHDLHVFVDISDVQDEIAYDYWKPASGGRLTGILRGTKRRFYKTSFVFRTAADRLSNVEKFSSYWGGVEAYYRSRARWTHSRELYEKWGREGLDKAARYMNSLYELCEEHGIRMTVAVYPWPEQIYVGEQNSIQERFWRDFARRRELEFINLFPRFVGRGDPRHVVAQFFIDGDVHWNEAGHREIARAVLASMDADNLSCSLSR